MCGTAEYLAPEIILDKEGYDKSCDWFSFGALMFEMLCGHHPFPRKGKKIDPRIYMSPIKIPRYLTDDARNLLGKLLEVNPRKRIGFNGAEEIRKHPYFKDIDFEKVFAKAYTPPFVPKLKEETDLKYFDPGFTSEEVDSFKDNDLGHKQNPDFEGFTYQPEEMVEEDDQNYDVDAMRGTYGSFIDNELDKETEINIVKVLFACEQCAKDFLEFAQFEYIAKEFSKYISNNTYLIPSAIAF